MLHVESPRGAVLLTQYSFIVCIIKINININTSSLNIRVIVNTDVL